MINYFKELDIILANSALVSVSKCQELLPLDIINIYKYGKTKEAINIFLMSDYFINNDNYTNNISQNKLKDERLAESVNTVLKFFALNIQKLESLIDLKSKFFDLKVHSQNLILRFKMKRTPYFCYIIFDLEISKIFAFNLSKSFHSLINTHYEKSLLGEEESIEKIFDLLSIANKYCENEFSKIKEIKKIENVPPELKKVYSDMLNNAFDKSSSSELLEEEKKKFIDFVFEIYTSAIYGKVFTPKNTRGLSMNLKISRNFTIALRYKRNTEILEGIIFNKSSNEIKIHFEIDKNKAFSAKVVYFTYTKKLTGDGIYAEGIIMSKVDIDHINEKIDNYLNTYWKDKPKETYRPLSSNY